MPEIDGVRDIAEEAHRSQRQQRKYGRASAGVGEDDKSCRQHRDERNVSGEGHVRADEKCGGHDASETDPSEQ